MLTISSMVSVMTNQGFALDQVLAHTGISESDLLETEKRVSYRQRIQQLENVFGLMDDPGYWLDSDASVSIADFGLLGYAMMSSATLEQAVQIAVKYHKMAGAMYELSFLQVAGDAVLRLDHFLASGIVSQYLVEDLFMGITPLISLLIGRPVQPIRISLNYGPATAITRYQRAFQCDINFNQRYCEYRFDSKFLAEHLAAADSDIAKSCEDACRALLTQMEIEEDLVSRICHLLLSTPGEFPKLGMIANHLSLGTRTLRRRLKGLGTSYQKVLDDVKKELAKEYLHTTDLSVQEISDLLGYSELTNFRRAFVKWASISPYQYRKRLEQD